LRTANRFSSSLENCSVGDACSLRLVGALRSAAALVGVRCSLAAASRRLRGGGAYRDRTDDLMLAKQPLSQLS
jgi:hypothetical protein